MAHIQSPHALWPRVSDSQTCFVHEKKRPAAMSAADCAPKIRQAAGSQAPVGALLGPKITMLPPPRPIRGSCWDTVSRKAEQNISGKLQRNPRRDKRADKPFKKAKNLILCRADTARDFRVGAINNVLARMPHLTSLSIGLDLSAQELSGLHLDHVPYLQSLDVRCNTFGDAGAKALPLECLPRLQRLSVAGCALSAAGLAALRIDCTLLVELDIRGNAIDTGTALGLLRRNAPRLETLIVDAPSGLASEQWGKAVSLQA